MNVMCRVRGHSVSDGGIWNEGYCFSNCARCGCDLMRSSGDWRPVPQGYAVIWRRGRHQHAIPIDFTRNLPLVVNSRPRWKLAWKLGLHRRAIGCIMLPADKAYCRESAPEREATPGFVVSIAIIIVQSVMGTSARAQWSAHR